MKLSKKILKTFSVIAMLAASMAVVSCAAEEDDDEENAITGSNNDYSIDFTNNDPLAMYRAYHATFNKHRPNSVTVPWTGRSAKPGPCRWD